MNQMKANTAHKIPLKRARNESKEKKRDSDSEYEGFVTSQTWPRFLVMNSAIEEAPLHKLPPFAIQKGFQAIAGTLKSTKRLWDGSVLVVCNRKARVVTLLNTTSFVQRMVHVSVHKTLNSSPAVIRC